MPFRMWDTVVFILFLRVTKNAHSFILTNDDVLSAPRSLVSTFNVGTSTSGRWEYIANVPKVIDRCRLPSLTERNGLPFCF